MIIAAGYSGNFFAKFYRYISGSAFLQQHVDNLTGGTIAKELTEGFFMPGDGVTVDHRNKIMLGELR